VTAPTILPLSALPGPICSGIRGVLTDIDDTLSTHGKITALAYAAMERLHDAGLMVIAVTGRPAGWCDHIARMWPVDAVVGENGALYMRYDARARKLTTCFATPQQERRSQREQLATIATKILREVPGCAVASDQLYRESDLAIDFCEDVARLPAESVAHIVALMHAAGLTAKVSSIHVNGWFGSYDKLTMTRKMLAEEFGIDLGATRERFVFVGDSPNDASMFQYFPYSVGVANVREFGDCVGNPPKYVTARESGAGFAELADFLLHCR
jgi:HAD superfamily hydrolase (TIGR01484 family)